ncbi:C4-dicarboxylate TRAP transporter substrate-binding protein [Halanaerobium hydrogeniformans]|uniref:Extracellular solute-binding protein, family 7 n=1 Tax=Halanaerobium hydrogeniformans TaxID=656519 RepID=E4RPS8_HALHG|nr:C4-dicarboxylate TRAP transporter substrate-binding protein [Halanaerobium hydrogeniformans]ADQ13962.1 Extracellular solute-binding protein, family 7 [Halanaerobium hydrogeniformans]
MKKLSLVMAVVLFTGVILIGVGGSMVSADDDFQLTLRLSHVFSPEEQLTKSMDLVADSIREKTDGAINIQTFPQGQIAAYKDGVEQVARGANFISVEDPTYIGDYVPDFTAMVGPMLYSSFDEYVAMTDTELVEELKEELAEEHNIKVLSLDYVFGFRNVITDEVIETPEDLSGLRIRVPGSQLFIETLNAMGANATPLPWGETISAMQQGVVDGIEGSEFTNIGNSIYEVRQNVALTRHFLGACGVYINTDVWDSIPERYQTIIQEEFDEGAVHMVELLDSQHADVVEELESHGVEFNEVDYDAFVEATESIYDTFPGFSDDIYERLQNELEIIRHDLENQ